MANKQTRRTFLKRGINLVLAGAGATAGYKTAKKLGEYNPLEKLIDEFYQATHNTLAEVSGATEKRLTESVTNLKNYLGETTEDSKILSEYWNNIGLVSPQTFSDLEQAIKKAEYYVQEADFKERMQRLKDRFYQQAIRIDQEIESRYPEPLRNFNEWFSELIKGKEKGSRQALETYKTRLDKLVQVYDSNRNNLLAQSGLIDATEEYFSQAQDQVVKELNTFIQEPNINIHEKAFYEGLIDITQKDPTGRDLADYLLKTNGYFRTLGAIEGLEELSVKIQDSTREIKGLQELMDEGLELKNKIRRTNRVLPEAADKVQELIQQMEQQKQDLADKGYKINYELYPELKQAKDKLHKSIKSGNKYLAYAGAGIGAAIGYEISRPTNAVINGSEKKFTKKLAKELEKEKRTREDLEKELKQTKKQLNQQQTQK